MERREAVGAVIIRGGKLLLLENIENGSRYELPGGKVRLLGEKRRQRETAEEALFREAKEELGIIVKNERFLRVFKVETSSPWHLKLYLCSFQGEPTIKEPKKFRQILWATSSQIHELAAQELLAPGVLEAASLL